MSGILIPEIVISQTLESITKYIRNDLTNVVPVDGEYDYSKTFLYRLLGLDDDGNPIKLNRYNYFVQAQKVFSNPQNLSVNIGYNFEVAKIISFHIILPSEQPSAVPIGEDEGYLTETDDDGNIQLKFCQMFSSNYQIMITSDNMSEVNLVYHIYKSLLIALVPHLSLKGLMNPKFSGNDIVFQDDHMPMGIFHKVLNLSFDYELVVPQLLMGAAISAIHFEANAVEEFDDSKHLSPSGDDKREYPYHRVEPGKPILSTQLDSQDGRDYPSKIIEPGIGIIASVNEKDDYPSKIVEPGGSVAGGQNNDLYPSKIVEPGKSSFDGGKEFPTSHMIYAMYNSEYHTLNNVRIVVTDGEDVLVGGVAVELKCSTCSYYGITDENGMITFPAIALNSYRVTLAKSGFNQVQLFNIRFDSLLTYVEYSMVTKTIWDGMHADTNPIMYVDIHNGGGAAQV